MMLPATAVSLEREDSKVLKSRCEDGSAVSRAGSAGTLDSEGGD